VRAALAAAGIEWRHYYPRPAAAQPALGALRCAPGTFREAERRCAEVVSIPIRASLEPDAIREIARVVREAAGRGSGSDR
jgi:dTDP-4-amino-4,6-dideoxygalactose transaminase